MGKYYPNPSANSVCVKNIIDSIDKKEYCITIVCYDDFAYYDCNNIKIKKIKRNFFQNIFYKTERKKNIFSKLINVISKFILKYSQLLFLCSWPFTDPLYAKKVLRIVKKMHKREKFDYIVAVHKPISSLYVGSKMKKIDSSIKYIAYFLDSLSGGRPLSIKSDTWNLNKGLKLENKLLNNADKILFMDSTRKHHEKYNIDNIPYDKVCYVDIPYFISHKPIIANNSKNDKKMILFCGTANYPLRNIAFFLKVINEISDNTYVFYFIGDTNYNLLIKNNLQNVVYLPNMSRDDLEVYLQNADFYLNLGVKVSSTISGKIFEYISYGKPIITTYSIDEEASISYLKRYPLSFFIDERDIDYKQQARKLLEFLNNNIDKRVDLMSASNIFYKNKPEYFVSKVFDFKYE